MVLADVASSTFGGRVDVHKDSVPKSDVAAAILRYISSRPGACDALEGVTDWWLARQRYEDTYDNVAAALKLLISRGEVEAVQTADGRVIYRVATPPPDQPGN